ncbi:transposon protein [Nesidiocoris tenuis]|uniref:Transposon protein n=1 Tax=Nesidiocoris tenuis TaxID=355587 RepID=A0ABN7AHX0_9HEMI|nr:transposon protein [Nesidiocoris tenuis]
MDGTVGKLNCGSKKRRAKWLDVRKSERDKNYADSDPNLVLLKRKAKPCDHLSKNFKCTSLKWSDIALNREAFYSKNGKVNQDLYLTQHLSAYEPERRRVQQPKVKRNVSVSYFMKTSDSNKMVQVCKGFFCFAFGISSHRVLAVGKRISTGSLPKEKRGGDHKSYRFTKQREAVREFIRKLKCTESHYGRNKSARVYLPAGTSVRKLLNAYNEAAQPGSQVQFSFFYKILTRDFNIGVSSPATDVCGTCTRLKSEIQVAQAGEQAKQNLIMELRVHKLRAKAFYELMKEAESMSNSIAFVFDLQQVHPLPKTPIGDAFYRRQIAFYTFCCVGINSLNPTFYTWTEVQGGRGAVQIGSCLLHHLNNLQFEGNVEKILLFCDGCGGQNKNSHILHTLSYWLQNKSPSHVQSVQLTFPVRGHSFLPADRVFGRAERILKNIPVITTPEQYEAAYSQVGRVVKLGEDWQMLDVKDLQETYSKANGISQAKRIFIKKFKDRSGGHTTRVKFQANFRYESNTEPFRSIVKRGRKERSVNAPPLLPLGRSLTKEKKKDVEYLLETHFGRKWKELPELRWYLPILFGGDEEQAEQEEQGDEPCSCLDEESPSIHV